MHPQVNLTELINHGFSQREVEQIAGHFRYLKAEPAAVSLTAYMPDAGEQLQIHKCGRIDDLCGNTILEVI